MQKFGWKPQTDVQMKDLNAALAKYDINSPARVKNFMAQCGHEVDMGRIKVEGGSNAYFNRYEGRKDLGNTQPGDGHLYKGGGNMQLTGREWYQKFSNEMKDPKIMTGGAAYVAANYPWSSAAYEWKTSKINQMVDRGASVREITKKVNGGYNGLSNRIATFGKADKVFNGEGGAPKPVTPVAPAKPVAPVTPSKPSTPVTGEAHNT